MAKKAKPKKTEKHVIPVSEILKKLHLLGYFGDKSLAEAKKIRGAELAKAIKEYQKFNGIDPTGVVEPKTAHRIARARCGLPDFNLTMGGHECRWPMKNITYYHELNLPGLSSTQVSEAFAIAFSQWAEVCDITPTLVSTPNKANIYARSGLGRRNNLDDRGGTLAWSELPCGVTENIQLDQMYDEAEAWSFNMAVAVMCHELGHALGLPHLNDGNLMAPYYDPNVTTPQRGDIQEIVKIYGRRRHKYSITEDAAPAVSGKLVINGRPYVLVPQT
jgi:hypothetical protein